MKNLKNLSLLSLLIISFTVIYSTVSKPKTAVAATIYDTFDRPDSSNLGSNWSEVTGDWIISGNKTNVTGTTQNLAVWEGAINTPNSAAVDVSFNNNSLEYAGVVVGYADPSNNIFVKVQGSNNFSNIGIYYGNNGSGWGSGSGFLPLNTPFTDGRILANLLGDVLTVEIDNNSDGITDETFIATNTPTANLGNQIGIVSFSGDSTLDNFGDSLSLIEQESVPEASSIMGLIIVGGLLFSTSRSSKN